MKKVLAIVLALVLTAAVALASAETLVVGATAVPHAEILEQAKPVLAAKGVDLEIVVFDDYVQPNRQLADGDLDANYFQHVPYLTGFNASNGTNLAVLGAVHYEPMGIYGGKTAALDAIKAGAVIGIPNDPSNEVRALELLAALDLIVLPEVYDTTLTVLDITGDLNPLKLELIEIAAEQLPRQLADFDFAVINSNYALEAGVEVVGTALACESTEVSYPNVVAIREGDTNPLLQTLIDVLQSDEIANWITETYGTAVVPTTVY